MCVRRVTARNGDIHRVTLRSVTYFSCEMGRHRRVKVPLKGAHPLKDVWGRRGAQRDVVSHAGAPVPLWVTRGLRLRASRMSSSTMFTIAYVQSNYSSLIRACEATIYILTIR